MRAIVPSLWFDGNLEEAITFYSSVFPDAKVGDVFRQPDGTAVSADFELAGHRFAAINGGPQFPFTEAVSFVVECDSQDEVDRYWDVLTANGGQESQCGWLKDRFGLSWQIVPKRLYELTEDPDTARSDAAVKAMMGMRKIVIADLEAAADGV